MKKFSLLLVLFFIIFQSCRNEGDDCDNILCFTPPHSFQFEIIDKTTGENLLTNGTYKPENISIKNVLNNNEQVSFNVITENNRNVIVINSIGWKTEKVNLQVKANDNLIFSLYVDAERKNEECCSYTQYNEIKITDSEFEVDKQTGIYKILVK
ncbi:hypothetical protein [Flavobacterium aquiphilum]|uniref:hypothetical protein n=1 Tax=Flavobacterium aquiphilum TaxID=3003261 RepID=UPI002481700C|nr:hypothetical protein [Flavobacterium aquiphilum]